MKSNSKQFLLSLALVAGIYGIPRAALADTTEWHTGYGNTEYEAFFNTAKLACIGYQSVDPISLAKIDKDDVCEFTGTLPQWKCTVEFSCVKKAPEVAKRTHSELQLGFGKTKHEAFMDAVRLACGGGHSIDEFGPFTEADETRACNASWQWSCAVRFTCEDKPHDAGQPTYSQWATGVGDDKRAAIKNSLLRACGGNHSIDEFDFSETDENEVCEPTGWDNSRWKCTLLYSCPGN